ncbi:thioesterase family protein, partial [Thalassospira lucentensis]
GMMRALKKSGSGAGGTINDHEASLQNHGSIDHLPVTVDRQIPQSWTDYNGHMNEAHYVEISAQASDRFMELIGADAEYITAGSSYFTVENHVCYVQEITAGDRISVTTQLIKGLGKKLHLFHRLMMIDGQVAATVETMLLHVDLKTRRTSEPGGIVATNLAEIAAEHDRLAKPEQLGRAIG